MFTTGATGFFGATGYYLTGAVLRFCLFLSMEAMKASSSSEELYFGAGGGVGLDSGC